MGNYQNHKIANTNIFFAVSTKTIHACLIEHISLNTIKYFTFGSITLFSGTDCILWNILYNTISPREHYYGYEECYDCSSQNKTNKSPMPIDSGTATPLPPSPLLHSLSPPHTSSTHVHLLKIGNHTISL